MINYVKIRPRNISAKFSSISFAIMISEKMIKMRKTGADDSNSDCMQSDDNTCINEDGPNLVLKFGPGELQRVIVDGTKWLKNKNG